MTTADAPLTTLLGYPEVDRAYRAYLATHFGDLSDPQGLALAMFRAGGRAAVQDMVAFSDLLPRMSYMEQRLLAMKALLETMGGAS